FFTTTPTSDIYTLSLHDALPIFLDVRNVGAKNVFKPADRFHAALFRLWQHGFEDVEITVVGRAEIFENGVPIIFRMHSRVIPAVERSGVILLLAVIGQRLSGDLPSGDAAPVR